MHIVGQIIEKNLHRRDHCLTGLWINPDKHDNWRSAQNHCAGLKLFSQDYGCYQFLKLSGADIDFAAFPQTPVKRYQWLILNLPRQKAQLDMMLDCAAGLLTDDGVLWLAGENRAGIKSSDKQLKSHFERVRKLDNARHCTLFEARNRLKHSQFIGDAYQQKWALTCGKSEISISSYPGVFAHGRLDAGTALLLESLSELQFEGQVLDFACGAGLLGACIAKNHPHTNVTLLDSNALALKASEETLAGNQLGGSVLASDGLSEVKENYDYVISNPPIHSGYKTDNLLSQRLLASVHEHINPGGTLIMVANLHLPYENWLSQRFRQIRKLAANRHFKVIAATK